MKLKFRDGIDATQHTALFDLRNAFTSPGASSTSAKAAIHDLPQQLPFWTRGKKIGFTKCWLVATKGLGLIGDGSERDLPTINGKATVNSLSIEDAEMTSAREAMQALGESIELVETQEDTTPGGAVWKDVEIQIKGLKPILDDKTSNALHDGRIWLLVHYSLS